MLDDDTLETGVKENNGKMKRVIDWLFDFYLSFLVTIGALICIPYSFSHPKVGIPVLIFSGIVAIIANL